MGLEEEEERQGLMAYGFFSFHIKHVGVKPVFKGAIV